MSGQDIIIEQLRAEVERLELALADVAMCDSSDCGRCIACLVRRAGKAERFIATADSEWKARAEKAERELERLRSDAKTLAAEHFAADYRAAIARADKAEDERDEARAERDARPAIEPRDSAAIVRVIEHRLATIGDHPVGYVAADILRAHAAKAVKS